ncbi:unnamed protein product [Spirodela intermedia]|uniref:Uncharacterized protein n=1 Tax=Spirodela intermedia TaxID=51605 RepID=A0A7I8IBJ3_SPIIN|nr:unnamed protein product [Spirodela intermedia]CAA6654412.1 unnamed protein product [Spirodela intermedia]
MAAGRGVAWCVILLALLGSVDEVRGRRARPYARPATLPARPGGAGGLGSAAEDDGPPVVDEKREVCTGPNPLHHR